MMVTSLRLPSPACSLLRSACTAVLAVAVLTGLARPAHAQMGGMDQSMGGASMGGDTGAAPSAGGGGMGGSAAGGSTASKGGGGGSVFMAPDSIYGLKKPVGPRPALSFGDAMGMALRNSYDLAIAQERFVQAQLFIRKAWSSLLPRLNAGVGYTFSWPETKFTAISQDALDAQASGQRAQLEGQAQIYDAQAAAAHADGDYNTEYANRMLAARLRSQASGINAGTAPDPVAINPVNVVNGTISFQMLLFNGRTFPAIMNAYDAVKQTRLTLDRAQTQALYMASVAYFSAVSTRKLTEIATIQVQNLERHLAATRVRVEVGALPMLALKRAEVDLTRARATLRTVEGAYESVISSLALLLGVDTAFDVEELPPIPQLEDGRTAEELIDHAIRNRPDIAAARIAVKIAERGRMDAIMRWLPQVTLGAQGRATSNTGGFSKDPISYNVALNASVPLYDGGERYTAWREANSKIREAKLLEEQALQKLQLSILGNMRELELRKANLENQRHTLELANAAARDARARFEVGAATNLEVLDAEQVVAAAAADLANAELELQLSRLALSFVTGTFDPAIGEPNKPVPRGVSPVVNLPAPRSSSTADAQPATPVAPALTTPARAARLGPAGRLPVHASATDLLRAGLFESAPAPAP